MALTSSRKKYLRSIGHRLSPVVIVASKGLTASVLEEIDRALNDHELIKVKLAIADRGEKNQTADEICQQLKAEAVQLIGHVLLLFRQAKKPNPKLSNLLR